MELAETAKNTARDTAARKPKADNDKVDLFYLITGEEFVLLATALALSLAKDKNAKETRFLSNFLYQASVALGAISTQRGVLRDSELLL